MRGLGDWLPRLILNVPLHRDFVIYTFLDPRRLEDPMNPQTDVLSPRIQPGKYTHFLAGPDSVHARQLCQSLRVLINGRELDNPRFDSRSIQCDVESGSITVIEDVKDHIGIEETIVRLPSGESHGCQQIRRHVEFLNEPASLRPVPPRPPHRESATGERCGSSHPGSNNGTVHNHPPIKHLSVRHRYQR